MHCNAFIFGYLAPGPRLQDHVDLIIFKVIFNQESWQYMP